MTLVDSELTGKHYEVLNPAGVPTIYVLSKNKKNIQKILLKIFNFYNLKPDLGVLSHNEMTLTLNTHTPLLTS